MHGLENLLSGGESTEDEEGYKKEIIRLIAWAKGENEKQTLLLIKVFDLTLKKLTNNYSGICSSYRKRMPRLSPDQKRSYS